MNYANRKAADTMDMTPEDIAKQRHHHDIVELLTDWSLGCNSPKAVPAPTSPPEVQKSPLASMASPPATSPPAVEIHNGGAPSLVAHFQPARPKTTVNRAPGTRPRSTGSNNNNNNAKRKRKKARPDEEVYPAMSTVTTLSPPNLTTSCATGQAQAFSPNCVPITNGLSPLGSTGISPADSTTLSPLHAPNSLDTQPPSPLEPLDILSPDDLAGLEGVQIGWEDLPLDDIDPFNDPADMSMCGFPPSTTIGPLAVVDHIVPTTSDCMYVPNAAPPVRRVGDLLEGQRLYAVHSTPDLHNGGLQHPDSRPLVFNGRSCHPAQKAPNTTPSQLASYQAITNSNMFPGSGGGGGNLMLPRKDYQNGDYSIYHQQLQLHNHQLVYAGGERLPSQPQARPFVNGYESSPQKFVSSFPTPSPDSPGQWSSSSSSSSC